MIKIHLTSPGFKVSKQELLKTKKFWFDLGVEFIHESHLLDEESDDLLCSGKLEVRLKELKKAFESKESTLVWSLRGGYGAHQLLPFLKDISFDEKKLFMGFSDGTSLHYYLNMHLNWPSIHAPHPNTFYKGLHDKSVLDSVVSVIEGGHDKSEFSGLEIFNSVKKVDFIEADLIGGNITTLVSLLGTPFNRGAEGKILLLEEIEEPAYKIMRSLHHLSQANFFDGVKAIVFGHMIHSKPEQQELICKCVREWAKESDVCVVWGLSAGHNHKENMPLWFLKKTRLYLDDRPRLLNNV